MSEVGIISQKYEDRRTKKVGTLLERDEKYKTLLFKSDDGKTFNVSYGGFKSNWRKTENLPTVEESMEEIEIPIEPKTELVEIPEVKITNSRDASDLYESVCMKVTSFSASFMSSEVTSKLIPRKNGIALKIGNKRVFEVYAKVRENKIFIVSYDSMMHYISNADNFNYTITNHPKWIMTSSISVPIENLDDILNLIRDYVVKLLSENIVEEE